ncbi:DUF1418 family protein [Erwinia sp. CPCC 100877]|nr:DUF1418 family protein [Erwinia sp. CPCC 100877]
MRTLNDLPKPVILLELLGMILLGLTWLSINEHVALPVPLNGTIAAVVMVCLGVALMLPAAFMLLWGVAHNVTPLLLKSRHPQPTQSGKEKRDDADH